MTEPEMTEAEKERGMRELLEKHRAHEINNILHEERRCWICIGGEGWLKMSKPVRDYYDGILKALDGRDDKAGM